MKLLLILLICYIIINNVLCISECLYKDFEDTCFGHKIKSKYFYLDPNYINFNHGSYGTCPIPVATQQQKYYIECETNPDLFIGSTYYNYIINAREAISKVVNSDVNDIVLVENASAAINSILRSIGLQKGDKVLRLSTSYGMVINTLNWLISTIGIEVIVVDVEFPSSSKQIENAVKEAMTTDANIKLAIFSHISSMPAMIEPIENLVKIVKSINSKATILVDGAHAAGSIPIDLQKLNPDYYLSNGHKWMFGPKGTAFLYVNKANQFTTSPEPTVIFQINIILLLLLLLFIIIIVV